MITDKVTSVTTKVGSSRSVPLKYKSSKTSHSKKARKGISCTSSVYPLCGGSVHNVQNLLYIFVNKNEVIHMVILLRQVFV